MTVSPLSNSSWYDLYKSEGFDLTEQCSYPVPLPFHLLKEMQLTMSLADRLLFNTLLLAHQRPALPPEDLDKLMDRLTSVYQFKTDVPKHAFYMSEKARCLGLLRYVLRGQDLPPYPLCAVFMQAVREGDRVVVIGCWSSPYLSSKIKQGSQEMQGLIPYVYGSEDINIARMFWATRNICTQQDVDLVVHEAAEFGDQEMLAECSTPSFFQAGLSPSPRGLGQAFLDAMVTPWRGAAQEFTVTFLYDRYRESMVIQNQQDLDRAFLQAVNAGPEREWIIRLLFSPEPIGVGRMTVSLMRMLYVYCMRRRGRPGTTC